MWGANGCKNNDVYHPIKQDVRYEVMLVMVVLALLYIRSRLFL